MRRFSKTFKSRVIQENTVLSTDANIACNTDTFIKENPNFAKIINILRLSAKQQVFTLRPIVAEFNTTEGYDACGHSAARIAKETKHPVYILPHDHVNNKSFTYFMVVSTEGIIDAEIANDNSTLKQTYDDEDKRILNEHFGLINECIRSELETESEFKDFVYTVTPMHPINRMYGYDGSWIMYRLQMKDIKELYWSPPIVNSKYSETQPFLIFPQGEFLILEMDGSEACNDGIDVAMKGVEERKKYNKSLTFRDEERITVDEAWIIDHGVQSAGQVEKIHDLKEALITLFGEHIPYPTMSDGYDLTAETIAEIMRRECIGQPIHMFNRDLINKYSIDNTI